MINKRSVDARLARNVLVGDLNELFLITVRIISTFPETPRANVKLKWKKKKNCDKMVSVITCKPEEKEEAPAKLFLEVSSAQNRVHTNFQSYLSHCY